MACLAFDAPGKDTARLTLARPALPVDSGPKRYDWDQDHRVWFYHRDGDLLHDLLNRELRELLGNERIEVDLAERDES